MLQVIFRKGDVNYWAVLRKITYKDKASYDSTPRYMRMLIMGWLRSVGSLKLQVSFAKEPYKRDDILQKRPVILRSLLIVATPYE